MPYVVHAKVSDHVFTELQKRMQFTDDEVSNNEEALILFGMALAEDDGFERVETEIKSINVSYWSDRSTRDDFGPELRSTRVLTEETDG